MNRQPIKKSDCTVNTAYAYFLDLSVFPDEIAEDRL